MFSDATLNIKYKVKDLLRTIDFYNILLGDRATDFYPKHAVYTVKSMLLTLTFIEDFKVERPARGSFILLFNSDGEVYERFVQFTRAGFSNTLKIDQSEFGPNNHAFCIEDPNGIYWKLGIKDREINTFHFFKIPRVNSVWDILKPF